MGSFEIQNTIGEGVYKVDSPRLEDRSLLPGVEIVHVGEQTTEIHTIYYTKDGQLFIQDMQELYAQRDEVVIKTKSTPKTNSLL